MAEGNGSTSFGDHKRIHTTPDFLGSHQGLQPALHPLPRHRDGVDVARRTCRPPRRSTSFRRSPTFGNPILVLSGGEPLYRPDIFELAEYATSLRTARRAGDQRNAGDEGRCARRSRTPASSGSRFRWTAPTPPRTIRSAEFPEPSTPPSTACATCRSWASRCRSTRRSRGTTRTSCPRCSTWRADLGADALHTFLLVPVGCGVDIAAEQMVAPDEYERMLNWFYDQSLTGDIELKATCAPHYFRVARQRRAADRRAGKPVPAAPIAHHPPDTLARPT